MALKLITPPALEPVLLEEAKAHLRVDHSDDDASITGLITVARNEAEKITRRALLTQVWELVLDGFPSCEISVPLPRLLSVTSIKYIDQDGTEQTLSADLYQVDSDSEPGRIVPAYGQTWPATRSQLAAVRVRFSAGYGATADLVPQEIKQWMLIRIGSLYENREADVPGFIDGLLDAHRVVRF